MSDREHSLSNSDVQKTPPRRPAYSLNTNQGRTKKKGQTIPHHVRRRISRAQRVNREGPRASEYDPIRIKRLCNKAIGRV